MKAVAVIPRKPDTLHLVDIPKPRMEQAPAHRGVLVRLVRVGLDGTDREIAAGQYGQAPPGSDFLVLGHESFGMVEEVGPEASEVAPGDYVVAMVRRPGASLYDAIGMQDVSTDDTYREHGINQLHGFLTEYHLDMPEYLVVVPPELAEVGVLLEPMSVVRKGIAHAHEAQRRLRIWRPRRGAVLGAGTIGLLATLLLRLEGLEVVTLALTEPPYLNSRLVEALGSHYVSTRRSTLAEASTAFGPFDIIFEATGFSPLAFQAMETLGKNGVLVLSSVTGGERRMEVPVDAINLGFVLGNKAMIGTVNANRDHYEAAVRDLALAQALYPGWLPQLLTHRVPGLANYEQAFQLLWASGGVIKPVVEVATT